MSRLLLKILEKLEFWQFVSDLNVFWLWIGGSDRVFEKRECSPLPDISISFSPENAFREPQKPFPGKCRKAPGNSRLPIKECRNATEGWSRELQRIYSRDLEQAFWDDFPWRMRTAKVDMLFSRKLILRAKKANQKSKMKSQGRRKTMKCTLWTETLEFRRLKMRNSRSALRGLAPP